MNTSHPTTPAALRLQRQMTSLIRAFGLHRPDLTPCGHPMGVSAAHALMELASGHPLTLNELTARLHLQKSTVSRLVDQLVLRRWVRRTPHPKDGRAILLQLSDAGQEVAQRVDASRAAKFAAVAAKMNGTELDSVLRALEVLVRAIDEHTSRAQRKRDDESVIRLG
ncbi:MAG TPA: MarR family transcriptional regulator [bacterium]|nr:MarR family transcriptional regulator [bacterium]